MNKKANNKLKKIKLILLFTLILCFVMLSGAGIARNKPKISAEKNIIYDYYDLINISDAFLKGYAYAYDIFYNKAVCVNGVIESIDTKGKSITIVPENGEKNSVLIICRDKGILNKYKVNDLVTVYGLIDKKSVIDSTPVISADGIAAGSSGLRMDYVFSDGKYYINSGAVEREIADGIIKYRIPDSWQMAEAGGEDKSQFFNIDLSDGNCYYLNSLKGKNTAECLCIFYFNNDKYVKYDSDKSQMAGIERAIISNICPSEKGKLSYKNITHYTFPTESVKTSYGLEYDAYVASYKTHRAEFLFMPAKNGVCVLMYVYNDDYSSYEDILYLMRTLEIKN